MKPVDCYDYQIDFETGIYNAFDKGARSVLGIMPGGGGKTVVSASIVQREMKQRNRVLFAAHRRELIFQAQGKWDCYDIQSSVYMGKIPNNPNLLAQVGSIQTIQKRDIKLTENDLIIIDEAHRSTAPGYQEFLFDRFPKTRILGLTGTPFGTKKKPLSHVFEDAVSSILASDIIKLGKIVPEKEYFAAGISSKFFKVKQGEFDDRDTIKAFDKDNVYLNLINAYQRHAEGLKTIVFCCNVDHSVKTAQAFTLAGYSAAHIDGTTPDNIRDAIMKAYAKGEIQILCNYGIAAEGFDVPDTDCVILNMATKSATKYFQACWRGARKTLGKLYYILIDMSDNFLRFGSPSQDIIYDPNEEWVPASEQPNATPQKICKGCQRAVLISLKFCNHCSYEFVKTREEVQEEEFRRATELEKKHSGWLRLKMSEVWKIKDEELEDFATIRNFKKKEKWLERERDNRERGYKSIKLIKYPYANMLEMQSTLQYLYFNKKPINAEFWHFKEETENQVVFEYRNKKEA